MEADTWACCWEGCNEPAAYAVTFHQQAGHVHDCARHTAALREFTAIQSVVPLIGCPYPHTTQWTDNPTAL